ncbi:hypothetical protein PIB30_106234, partial [Stylosanthes scabra]|nr:hypothetical protein [Stylosanthes scabra]
ENAEEAQHDPNPNAQRFYELLESVRKPLCEAYLSKETTFFCSYYFEPHVESVRTRIGRNDEEERGSSCPTLSVFNQP